MIPVSNIGSRPGMPPAVREAAQPARPAASSAPQDPPRPARDEYIPEKKAPEEERCVANTDEVDRELERLRERREELTRQLSSETDEAKVRALEQKLAQVERELSQKDNDSYRRRHTNFTNG